MRHIYRDVYTGVHPSHGGKSNLWTLHYVQVTYFNLCEVGEKLGVVRERFHPD